MSELTREEKVKIDRQKVYEKYNGHCAYCGCEVEYKQMQVDHIIPQCRFHMFRYGADKVDYEVHDMENLNPACRFCNNRKHAHLLDFFRDEMQLQVKRARETSANFRMAERYGQIQITESPIVFYFEKALSEPPSNKVGGGE